MTSAVNVGSETTDECDCIEPQTNLMNRSESEARMRRFASNSEDLEVAGETRVGKCPLAG